jgi:hypothetical protein
MAKNTLKPDTFDLTDFARYTMNVLIECTDRKLNWLPYCKTFLNAYPAGVCRHDQGDNPNHTAFRIDAFYLARKMCGSTKGKLQEKGLKDLMLGCFNEGDGLAYYWRQDLMFSVSYVEKNGQEIKVHLPFNRDTQ